MVPCLVALIDLWPQTRGAGLSASSELLVFLVLLFNKQVLNLSPLFICQSTADVYFTCIVTILSVICACASGDASEKQCRPSDVIGIEQPISATDTDLSYDCDHVHDLLAADASRNHPASSRESAKTAAPAEVAVYPQLFQLVRQPHHIRTDVAPIQSCSPRSEWCTWARYSTSAI